MPKTRTETLQLTDGRYLRLTVAEPERAIRGGLVVLHEARGVTEAVHKLLSGLAQEGWFAAAPHLYRDADVDGEDRVSVREQVAGLSGESVLADTDVTFVWLAEHGVPRDRLGVVGFGIGGAVAFIVAASRSLGAAVSIAGGGIVAPLSEGLPSLVDIAGELTCPWLGLYGDADEKIPAEQVEKLRDATAMASVATDLVMFPGDNHQFETSPEVTAEAWHRALNWLDSHLR